MLDTITASKLKNTLLETVKTIEKGVSYLVIRRGKPSAVILPIEEYEKMCETVRICQNKEFLKKLIDE